MKRLLILGAGTAGTTISNKLHRRLPAGWEIVVVDPAPSHIYQPGLLFVAVGQEDPANLVRPLAAQLPDDVRLIAGEVDRVDAAADQVLLADGTRIDYDQLVIATGTTPRPAETPGMTDNGWRSKVHEFYTLEGAASLRDAMAAFAGGRLVMHIVEMPIKCPVAPLEFTFLANDFFRRKGIRDRVDITYVTPLPAAFTKPIAAEKLGGMLEERGIALESDFYVERIDDGELVSFDERVVPFDLLVTVPINMGADFVERSGLGDELNHVRVDHGTFLAAGLDNVFAVGDAAALPTSKAGSAAHFEVDVFIDNFLDHIAGRKMRHLYDGHVNCFVESGGGKALLIDFNYETEPLPGVYPIPGVGPLRLLTEARMNHWAKLAFEPLYWNVLLRGRPLPVPTEMSLAGKVRPDQKEQVTA